LHNSRTTQSQQAVQAVLMTFAVQSRSVEKSTTASVFWQWKTTTIWEKIMSPRAMAMQSPKRQSSNKRSPTGLASTETPSQNSVTSSSGSERPRVPGGQ
ncbi:unnamed protein product, partial [Aphanomyces euteiches]